MSYFKGKNSPNLISAAWGSAPDPAGDHTALTQAP